MLIPIKTHVKNLPILKSKVRLLYDIVCKYSPLPMEETERVGEWVL